MTSLFSFLQNISPEVSLLHSREVYYVNQSRFYWINSPSDTNPFESYLFIVSHRNTRAICKACTKLKIKTKERRQWCRSVVFIFIFFSLNILHTLFWCSHCCLGTSKCQLGVVSPGLLSQYNQDKYILI